MTTHGRWGTSARETGEASMYGDLFDEDEEIERNITCQRCGEDDLHWELDGDVPKLYDEDGDRHHCEPSTKGFESL